MFAMKWKLDNPDVFTRPDGMNTNEVSPRDEPSNSWKTTPVNGVPPMLDGRAIDDSLSWGETHEESKRRVANNTFCKTINTSEATKSVVYAEDPILEVDRTYSANGIPVSDGSPIEGRLSTACSRSLAVHCFDVLIFAWRYLPSDGSSHIEDTSIP